MEQIPQFKSPENSKKESIVKLLDEIKDKQKEYYNSSDRWKDDSSTAHDFFSNLLQRVSGHSDFTYRHRNEAEKMEKLKSFEYGKDRYSPDDIDKDAEKFLSSYCKDELIADLGCGVRGSGYSFANHLGAAGYIGVEKEFAAAADESCKKMNGDTPFVIAQEDITAALSSMEASEIKPRVIIFSGIDQYSYSGKKPYEKYYKNLIKQIYSSMDEDGLLIVGGNLGSIMEGELEEIEKTFGKKEKIYLGNFMAFRKNNSNISQDSNLEQPENNQKSAQELAQEKWARVGRLGVTAKDHWGIGSSPPIAMSRNEGKTQAELMTDDELLKYLDELNNLLITSREKLNDDPNDDWAEGDIEYCKKELPLAIDYLRSIDRLPEKYKDFTM